jgi:hypothetical protein
MNRHTLSRISLYAALAAVACASLAFVVPLVPRRSMAFAQDEETDNVSRANQQRPEPMFAALPPRYLENLLAPSSPTVTHWSGSFSTGGTVYQFSMVGTNRLVQLLAREDGWAMQLRREPPLGVLQDCSRRCG